MLLKQYEFTKKELEDIYRHHHWDVRYFDDWFDTRKVSKMFNAFLKVPEEEWKQSVVCKVNKLDSKYPFLSVIEFCYKLNTIDIIYDTDGLLRTNIKEIFISDGTSAYVLLDLLDIDKFRKKIEKLFLNLSKYDHIVD